jgi:hypothetical protein
MWRHLTPSALSELPCLILFAKDADACDRVLSSRAILGSCRTRTVERVEVRLQTDSPSPQHATVDVSVEYDEDGNAVFECPTTTATTATTNTATATTATATTTTTTTTTGNTHASGDEARQGLVKSIMRLASSGVLRTSSDVKNSNVSVNVNLNVNVNESVNVNLNVNLNVNANLNVPRRRIIVIKHADRLPGSSQRALKKHVETAAMTSVLVFTTSRVNCIDPALKSRAAIINCTQSGAPSSGSNRPDAPDVIQDALTRATRLARMRHPSSLTLLSERATSSLVAACRIHDMTWLDTILRAAMKSCMNDDDRRSVVEAVAAADHLAARLRTAIRNETLARDAAVRSIVSDLTS